MKRSTIILGFAALCLIAALLIVGLSGTAVAQSRDTAPPPVLNFECPAGQVCHILWQPDSMGYNLCAGDGGQTGHYKFEFYGADSYFEHCTKTERGE